MRIPSLTLSESSYLLVGAAIFDALESNMEEKLRKQYQVAEEAMLHSYNISRHEYIELEDIVIKYQPHKAGAQWKFPGAFFFSLTVITTIGKCSSHSFSSSHLPMNAQVTRPSYFPDYLLTAKLNDIFLCQRCAS